MELEIAGAACMGEGRIWDISDIYTNDGGRGVDLIEVRDRAVRGSRHVQFSNPQTMMDSLR